MSTRGPATLAAVFWLEAILCGVLAWFQPAPWLLPIAGLAALFAGLMARGVLPSLVLASAASVAWFVFFAAAPAAPDLSSSYAIGALLIGALLAFLNILFFGGPQPVAAPHRVQLPRLAVPIHFVAAGVLFAASYLGGGWQIWLAHFLAAATLLLSLDTATRLTSRLYTPRRYWAQIPPPGAFRFYRWLGPEWRACLGTPVPRDESFSLQLGDMWMWPTVQKSLPALALASLALVWLATALHEVPVGSLGVRSRLGQWETPALTPGLHASLPWPLGGVQCVDTSRIREVVLGFQSDPGQAILWERAHYVNEQMSLVGGGDDFLSISVPVLYRVADPAAYLRSETDADGLLRKLADRLLLQLTVDRSAAEIMTTAREPLRKTLHAALQSELDQRRSGLAIAEVYLRDIHPPVTVAPAFQEVVGAMEEREAFIYEGEAYRRDNLTRARGSAKATVITARGTAEGRLLQARGQVKRFRSLELAWAASPVLYRTRETFRVFDETLGGAKKLIVDERLRGGIPAQVDLRKVMNPDFVDSAASRPETLVPGPVKSTEAFDLDIDGYLRMDRGEIPAVNVNPADTDNLLDSEQQKPAVQP